MSVYVYVFMNIPIDVNRSFGIKASPEYGPECACKHGQFFIYLLCFGIVLPCSSGSVLCLKRFKERIKT